MYSFFKGEDLNLPRPHGLQLLNRVVLLHKTRFVQSFLSSSCVSKVPFNEKVRGLIGLNFHSLFSVVFGFYFQIVHPYLDLYKNYKAFWPYSNSYSYSKALIFDMSVLAYLVIKFFYENCINVSSLYFFLLMILFNIWLFYKIQINLLPSLLHMLGT